MTWAIRIGETKHYFNRKLSKEAGCLVTSTKKYTTFRSYLAAANQLSSLRKPDAAGRSFLGRKRGRVIDLVMLHFRSAKKPARAKRKAAK